jgi:hypothetical protein
MTSPFPNESTWDASAPSRATRHDRFRDEVAHLDRCVHSITRRCTDQPIAQADDSAFETIESARRGDDRYGIKGEMLKQRGTTMQKQVPTEGGKSVSS